MLLHCGRRQEALRLLERAVDMSFCAFPALDLDPAWASLRGDADFQRIRGKASACHERFQAAVERVEAESSNH
jgi:hypothetical protein